MKIEKITETRLRVTEKSDLWLDVVYRHGGDVVSIYTHSNAEPVCIKAEDWQALAAAIEEHLPNFQDLKPVEPGGLTWTEADSSKAKLEGWDLFSSDDGGRIERLDEAGKLEDDSDAWCVVFSRAAEGSELHCKALLMISEAERDRLRSFLICGQATPAAIEKYLPRPKARQRRATFVGGTVVEIRDPADTAPEPNTFNLEAALGGAELTTRGGHLVEGFKASKGAFGAEVDGVWRTFNSKGEWNTVEGVISSFDLIMAPALDPKLEPQPEAPPERRPFNLEAALAGAPLTTVGGHVVEQFGRKGVYFEALVGKVWREFDETGRWIPAKVITGKESSFDLLMAPALDPKPEPQTEAPPEAPPERRPFNCREALAGFPVVTRDGRRVLHVAENSDADYLLLAWIEGATDLATYTKDGRYYDDGDETRGDLFMA